MAQPQFEISLAIASMPRLEQAAWKLTVRNLGDEALCFQAENQVITVAAGGVVSINGPETLNEAERAAINIL